MVVGSAVPQAGFAPEVLSARLDSSIASVTDFGAGSDSMTGGRTVSGPTPYSEVACPQ